MTKAIASATGHDNMSNFQIDQGVSDFVFSDSVGGTGRSIRVFSFCPRVRVRDARIIIAMHGLDRAAAEFRDVLVSAAEHSGQIILVPEFDIENFPDVYAYNYGNVMLSPPSMNALPRDVWSFGIVDRLFERVRVSIGSHRKTFGLFGNSAGAQFVLRYLALMDGAAVEAAVASNCGWYMLPDLNTGYPAGMAGLDLDDSHLRRYLGRRLTIELGDADTDSTAHDLPRGKEAMAQGQHRLARGFWYYEHCKKLAERLGTRFGWRLEVVTGAGHVSQQIFDRGVDLLAD